MKKFNFKINIILLLLILGITQSVLKATLEPKNLRVMLQNANGQNKKRLIIDTLKQLKFYDFNSKLFKEIIEICFKSNRQFNLNLNFYKIGLPIINYNHIISYDKNKGGLHVIDPAQKRNLKALITNQTSGVFAAYYHANTKESVGKFSTFFPENLDKQQILESIKTAAKRETIIAEKDHKALGFDHKNNLYIELFEENVLDEESPLILITAYPIFEFVKTPEDFDKDKAKDLGLTLHDFNKAIKDASSNIESCLKYSIQDPNNKNKIIKILDIAPSFKKLKILDLCSGFLVQIPE